MRKPTPQPGWPPLWQECYRYDRLEVFDDWFLSGYAYAYQTRYHNALKAVQHYLPPPAMLLDVAAAQGNFSLALAEKGYRVIWNDLREALVPYVQLKHETGDIRFLPGNIFELELPEAPQGIVATEIMEHMAHPDRFLQRLADLLAPGGYIFLTTPLGSYVLNRLPRFSDFADTTEFESRQFQPNSDGHIFLLYADEIRRLSASARLELLELQPQVNLLTNGHLKTHLLHRIMPYSLVRRLEELGRRMPGFLKWKLHANVLAVLRKPPGSS